MGRGGAVGIPMSGWGGGTIGSSVSAVAAAVQRENRVCGVINAD